MLAGEDPEPAPCCSPSVAGAGLLASAWGAATPNYWRPSGLGEDTGEMMAFQGGCEMGPTAVTLGGMGCGGHGCSWHMAALSPRYPVAGVATGWAMEFLNDGPKRGQSASEFSAARKFIPKGALASRHLGTGLCTL